MAEQPEQNENAYPMDVEHVAEMTRLLDQDQMLTGNMGGIFPESTPDELANTHDILDIACGPGGWVQEVAFAYPEKEVTGVDISRAMIEYAGACAQVRRLPNAHFRIMNILQPLDFPDHSFDLVNARFLFAVVPKDRWPALIAECSRMLRPGGILRLTESDFNVTTSPALQALFKLSAQSIYRKGLSFSPNGESFVITPVLPHLLRTAGFQQVTQHPFVIENSYGTPNHAAAYRDNRDAWALARAYILQNTGCRAEDFDRLYEQALIEIQSPEFCDLTYLLTVWGYKLA